MEGGREGGREGSELWWEKEGTKNNEDEMMRACVCARVYVCVCVCLCVCVYKEQLLLCGLGIWLNWLAGREPERERERERERESDSQVMYNILVKYSGTIRLRERESGGREGSELWWEKEGIKNNEDEIMCACVCARVYVCVCMSVRVCVRECVCVYMEQLLLCGFGIWLNWLAGRNLRERERERERESDSQVTVK